MNVVMNGEGKFVEVQGTGEEATYTRKELNEMLDQLKGIKGDNGATKQNNWRIGEENMKIFLATGNKHKIDEIKAIFAM